MFLSGFLFGVGFLLGIYVFDIFWRFVTMYLYEKFGE